MLYTVEPSQATPAEVALTCDICWKKFSRCSHFEDIYNDIKAWIRSQCQYINDLHFSLQRRACSSLIASTGGSYIQNSQTHTICQVSSFTNNLKQQHVLVPLHRHLLHRNTYQLCDAWSNKIAVVARRSATSFIVQSGSSLPSQHAVNRHDQDLLWLLLVFSVDAANDQFWWVLCQGWCRSH